MSANLSDPAIAHACDLISDPSDPTTWLLLHYSTPSSPSPIILLSRGPDPAVASLRTSLEASDEDVLFGYAEVGGKGLVLLLVSDAVGGVRRARAVVHSRAVASQLFPEYTAMITISHASELTDELVRDKLGLDYAQRRLPLAPHADEARGVEQLQQLQTHDRDPRHEQGRPHPNSISLNDEEERFRERAPALPHKPRSSSSIPRATPSPSPLPDHSAPGELPPAYFDADGHPLPKVPVEPISDLPLGPIDAPAASLPPLLPPQRQPHQFDQEHLAPALPLASTATPEHLPLAPNSSSNKGISSADFFPDRTRKTSLSSRLKGAIPGLTSDFGGGSNRSVSDPNAGSNSPHVIHGRTASGSQPRSPTASASAQDAAAAAAAGIHSPESPSNNKSKFTKFFSRRRSGNNEVTPPGSPSSPRGSASASASANGNGVRSDAPPVPPKDSFPPQPDRNGLFGIGEENGSPHVSNNGHVAHGQAQGYGGMSSHHPEEDSRRSLSPSQSAKVALAEARERRVAQESEIQDRFRQDQVERDRIRRHSGNRNAVVLPQTPQPEDDDDDEDVGLPYDRDPPPEVPESVEGADGAEGGEQIASSSFPHDGGVPLGHIGEKEIVPASLAAPAASAAPIDAAVPNTTTTVDSGGTFGANPAERLSMAAEEHAERLKAMREEEEARVEAEKEAYRVEMQRRADEEARQAEAARLREEQEARAASEAAARAAAEEEARLRREEEERRIEAERMEEARKLAEAKRLEAERLEAEKLEAERKEQVEKERIEAERLKAAEEERARVAQQERLRAEEEARRVEEERKRREAVREGMRRSKNEGGVMLKGWITVQTFRSMTWRRRYFHLFGTEMKLFKSEGDAAPIQTIHLGQGTSVSQTYEESQVQGSFKIASKGGSEGDEDFFLFTDSPEDKETVLEGLGIAVQ